MDLHTNITTHLHYRYTYNSQPDKAIEYNLRLRRPNAFELIQEYNMFDAVKDKAVLLMEFDQHLLEKEGETKSKPSKMPAVQLLVKNTDAIPVSLFGCKKRGGGIQKAHHSAIPARKSS